MVNLFDTGSRRIVSHTNFNRYDKGTLHQDRVMGEHDIFYMQEGCWEVGQDGIRYKIEQGDAIILHAGHHHYGISACTPGTRTAFIHLQCLPGDELIAQVDGELPSRMISLPVVVRCGESIAITALLEDIVNTFWSQMPHKQVKLAALLDILFYEFDAASKRNIAGYDKLVNDTLRVIRSSSGEIYTISQLSDLLHVCSRSLTDRFRHVTGKTIHQYQVDLKLEMGFMLMKDNPDRPLKELAANLGFYDEFHFSKLFKKKYGMSAMDVKKSARNK